MPRKRPEGGSHGRFGKEAVMEAVKAVRGGMSLRCAAKKFNLQKSTVQRYVKSTREQENLTEAKLTPNYACRRVFTDPIEKNLAEYLIDCAKMGFGLDTIQVRELAFKMAKANSLKYPSGWEDEEKAGTEWLFGFRKRHPELSMRKPEPCSVNRASAFTPENMKVFFDNLKSAMDRHPCFADGSRVYNLDEIGTTTVGSVKRKILAPTGVKQIPQSKTAERGTLVTTTCIIGANGTALPPVMVFPRVNYQAHMLIGAYPGTLGLAAPSGWMNSDLFPEVLSHFVKHTRSSKENPTLLIMDNDSSHLAIPALDIAKQNGVTLLTLSPHTSHKTQPLDVAVFSAFRTYYDSAMRSWTMSNPGKNVTIYHLAEFVKSAMEKAMTPGTILSGFRKCGIFPFNPDVFTEADYLAASPFRPPEEAQATESGERPVQPATAASTAAPTAPGSDGSTTPAAQSGTAPLVQDQTPGPSKIKFQGPLEIRGLPRKSVEPGTPKPNRRKKGRSMIPTDTPEKVQLEAQKAATAARKRPSKGKKSKPKRACISSKGGKKKCPSPPTSDDEPDDPDAVPLADSDASETWVEEEDDDNGSQVIDPASLPKLDRNPHEEEYVLLKIRTPTGNKKKQDVSFKIGKVLSNPDGLGCVTVSLLKKSEKVKEKFVTCNPVQIETVNVKKTIVMILPKPNVAGTRRQQYQLSFNVDLSLVPFK